MREAIRSMADPGDFQTTQYAFAAHIRDPQVNPAPADVEDRRMAIYRDLFRNNIDSFLRDSLPVLHTLLPAQHWDSMVDDFIARHRCHSPYFLDIPREFLTYLEQERDGHPEDPPFLFELAHYEWAELALSVAEDNPALPDLIPDGDLLKGIPVISPLAWPLKYRFAVHRIGNGYQPFTPGEQPTYLLLYRDREQTVRFLELNPVSARLLDLLHNPEDERAISGKSALLQIADELQHPNPDTVITGGRDILADWRSRNILLGIRG